MDKNRYFGVLDYVVVISMLVLSTLVGIYYAFFSKLKQNTASEYLFGGRKIGVFPMAMSLAASLISGILIVGLPSEIYVYGTQMWVGAACEVVAVIMMAVAVIPVFYTLNITSSYEYFNLRFNPHVRTLASILFVCKMIFYIPIVMYLPSLALARVSGLSVHAILPTVCIVCTFYTALSCFKISNHAVCRLLYDKFTFRSIMYRMGGGLRAVVWTDALQLILMLISVITVVVIGVNNVRGPDMVWKRSLEGNRIEFFNMSLDPTVRQTFWNVAIGQIFHLMSACTVNQAMVQRCIALPSLKKARMMLAIYCVFFVTFFSLSCYTGLVIYATYRDCDPKKSGRIAKADEILPYFVMQVAGHIPLLPGFFISGTLSSALSTMSTALNSMAAIILKDFVKPAWKKPISDYRASMIMKVMTVLLGTIIVFLSLVVDKLDGLIQTTISVLGITGGTLFGIFLLGMLLPWANTAGALSGGFAATALVAWISFGNQLAIYHKQLIYPTKPFTTDGCFNYSLTEGSNGTIQATPPEDTKEIFFLYQVSHFYYTFIGVITVFIIGTIVSYFTGFNDPTTMNPDVISPVIQYCLKIKPKRTLAKQQVLDVRSPYHRSQLQPFIEERKHVFRMSNLTVPS